MAEAQRSTAITWYLIQCKPRQDERAEENLLRQGYSCYRPKIRRRAPGSNRPTQDSLFPGYLFIAISPDDAWAPLRSTRGVARVVGFGGQPQPISAELIGQLRQRESAPLAEASLKPGEKVRIKQGPLAEMDAIFLSMDGNERVVLLLNIMQREQKVRAPLSGIRRV
jgi:transcriptional antiterminator RfaH